MTDRMCFRTVVDARKSRIKIGLGKRILCAGSCFAEHIGARLVASRFNACVNPTGPLFNPASMAALLKRLHTQEKYLETDLFYGNGLWRSWDHHGRFSAASSGECLAAMNAAFEQGVAAFKNCNVVILTFGTAFVYRLAETGRVVANCHKQPHDLFVRELLKVNDIVDEYTGIFNDIYKLNPNALCVVTLSPVRHLRDDPHENLVSKSSLACAVHELEKAFPMLYYFPAYEIMMDDLRDYRFYEKDMAHPNEAAVDYIWEKFIDACVEERSRRFIKDYDAVKSAMAHRVMGTGEEVRRFAKEQLVRIGELEKKYPEVGMEKERECFN
jgi:hypothetical protein